MLLCSDQCGLGNRSLYPASPTLRDLECVRFPVQRAGSLVHSRVRLACGIRNNNGHHTLASKFSSTQTCGHSQQIRNDPDPNSCWFSAVHICPVGLDKGTALTAHMRSRRWCILNATRTCSARCPPASTEQRWRAGDHSHLAPGEELAASKVGSALCSADPTIDARFEPTHAPKVKKVRTAPASQRDPNNTIPPPTVWLARCPNRPASL